MSDFEAREHLSAYLDGELSGEALVRMEEALETDAALRVDLDELREVIDGLGSLPEIEAPEGLFSAVMAGVAGLPIPGVDLAAESSELATAIPRTVAPPPVTPGFWETILNLSWWLKGPAMSAAAALLVIGVVYVGGQSDVSTPPTPVALRGSASTAESAPVPSGVLAGDDLMTGDAVVDLGTELEAEEAAPMAEAEPVAPLMAEAEPTVLAGAARPDAPPPMSSPAADRSRSSASEVDTMTEPGGVYAPVWESQGDAVADASEAGASSGSDAGLIDEGEGLLAPQDDFDAAALGFAPDEATVAAAEEPRRARKADREADSADLTMDGEPLEDWLDPPADDDIVASGRVASAEQPSTSSGSVPRGKAGGPVSLDEVTFTGVGTSGTLVVSDRAAADQLVQSLRDKGWTATVSGEQASMMTVDIRVPSSSFDELRRTLAARGSLSLGSAPTASDGQVQLRLSVAWGS